MNYRRIYDELITKAKQLNREKGKGEYFERHHIIPRSLGGLNRKDNLVLLTAKEHYLAHMLLVEFYEEGSYAWQKMVFAASMFLGSSKKHKRGSISGRTYQRIRAAMSRSKKGIPKSEEVKAKIRETKAKNPYLVTEEERQRRSTRMKGERNPMYGKTHTEEVRARLRESRIGKKNLATSESNRRRAGKKTKTTRAIEQLTKTGEVLNTFSTISEARRCTGINSIIGVLRGHWKYAGGYAWRYVEKREDDPQNF